MVPRLPNQGLPRDSCHGTLEAQEAGLQLRVDARLK